jgi:hypothetical protein
LLFFGIDWSHSARLYGLPTHLPEDESSTASTECQHCWLAATVVFCGAGIPGDTLPICPGPNKMCPSTWKQELAEYPSEDLGHSHARCRS